MKEILVCFNNCTEVIGISCFFYSRDLGVLQLLHLDYGNWLDFDERDFAVFQ